MYFVFLIFFVLRFSLWWCDFQCWWTSVGHGLVPNSWYVGKRWLYFILIVYEPFSLSLTVSCHGLGEIIDFNFSWSSTVKFRKQAPRPIFFRGPFWGAYFWRGLSAEKNLRFKIDWASLIVGRKFTVFALFYVIFEGNFQVQDHGGWGGGAYILWGDLMEGFLPYEFWGLIFGGAYTREGLFPQFYGI